MTRIFIEGNELDIDKELVNRITYSVDDLLKLDTKTTSFSSTIVLPGTTNNNNLLGNIFDFNNSNFHIDADPNVKYNFNASRRADARIEVNGLQIIKGTFRLMEIIYNGGQVEYECQVVGELGGFVSAMGNSRLEDLDFSVYNHSLTYLKIKDSWGSYTPGQGYTYPLIDYGNVSTNKKDFSYRTFRPALFLREYIDKIITGAGYTWEAPFFDTDLFKRIIIPNNAKQLSRYTSTLLKIGSTSFSYTHADGAEKAVSMGIQTVLGFFVASAGNTIFTYTGGPATSGVVSFRVKGNFTKSSALPFLIEVRKNGSLVSRYTLAGYAAPTSVDFDVNLIPTNMPITNSDVLTVAVVGPTEGTWYLEFSTGDTILDFVSSSTQPVLINIGEAFEINDTIPRGIFQKDLFASVLKMFYLYVTEDKYKPKHLIITPFIDFYDTTGSYIDWSDKVDHSKQIRVKPMSEINARVYELKFKNDSDYFADDYRKKYNEGYGDRLFDNGLDFGKEKETVEVIFAGSVLYGTAGEDKIYPAIYKLSSNNTKEDPMDHVIRIMQTKYVTGVASWDMLNVATVLGSNTVYQYAGHLDDPDAPDADINFGVPKELFFSLVSGNLSNNLFNAFYSEYMAEITDKDSRLLTCMVKLTETDIYNLDFSKFIFIDGGLYRLQKLGDFEAGANGLTKAELLRVIYTTY